MEREKAEEQIDLIKTIIKLVDQRVEAFAKAMFEANELAGCISNPKLGKEILDRKQLEKDRQEIKEEEFEGIWEEMKEFIPQSFHIVGDDSNLEGGIQIDLERFNEYVADEIEKENK